MEEVAEDGLEGLPRGAEAEQGAGGAVEEEAVGDWGIATLLLLLKIRTWWLSVLRMRGTWCF